MDFTTTEAAHDLGNLVDTIVDSVCTPEHQRELDGLDQRFDRDLWRKLIDAGILSSASASALGGDGFGALEQVAILVALGHQLAAVPYLESVVLGAGALARFGSEELQQNWGVPAVNGEKTLSVALDGEMGEGPVRAAGAGAGYRLTGTRTQVGFAPVADAFLVPAETDSGTAVFLVAADDPGVTVTALRDHRFGQRRAPGARWNRGGRQPQGRWRRGRHVARHAGDIGPQRFPARGARAGPEDDSRIRART